jgi:hypothetical protein
MEEVQGKRLRSPSQQADVIFLAEWSSDRELTVISLENWLKRIYRLRNYFSVNDPVISTKNKGKERTVKRVSPTVKNEVASTSLSSLRRGSNKFSVT